MAQLTGAIDNRRRDAAFSILASRQQVLYLVFLLGDPAHPELTADLLDSIREPTAPGERPPLGVDDIALLEPLVRAVGRDNDALARVAGLMDELRSRPSGEDLVPDGLDDLWDVVWQVHQESAP